jgi:exodeoxyribonuclease V beta subunit
VVRVVSPTAFDAAGTLPTHALALEASAGTGKTWTLTSLAVRYIAELDIPLPDLLLVTFTRAATAELRERVRGRLAEALAAAERALADPGGWNAEGDPVLAELVGAVVGDPTELELRRDRLQRASEQLDEATITTIHGFCQRMLQHAALEAGVDFDAVLLEDDADLVAEIVDDLMARTLRPADPPWVRYVVETAGIDRKRLLRLARTVAGLPTLQLLPDLPGDGGHETADDPFADWTQAIDRFRAVWESGGREEAVALVSDLHAEGGFTKGQQTYTAKRAVKEAQAVSDWLADPLGVPPGRLKPDTASPKECPPHYFTSQAMASRLQGPAPQHPVLDAAEAVVASSMAPATRYLHRAATWIWEELDRRKRQRTVLTFDDLLRRLADALTHPATAQTVRQAVRQRYCAALIDEFQDTDPVQWRIFSTLFGMDEPVVLIGDPKQAIYAFRGADVHTYVAARDQAPLVQTLQTNRRSDESYVRACNHLFGQPRALGTDDIRYHAIDPHEGDRLDDPEGVLGALRLRFLRRAAGGVEDEPKKVLTKGWADRHLAKDVAGVAVGLLTSTIRLRESGRGLRPKDLAVLVRTNRRALQVQRALHEAGVPAVIQRGGSVFVSPEAVQLQRFLDALLRPAAERAAVTAAATPLFGRDAVTLVAQRDALDRAAHTAEGAGAEDLAGEWDAWLDGLQTWSDRWHRDGVFAALHDAFAAERVPERLLATPGGERSLTNLRHLVELLHTAETGEGLTPTALVDWLRTQRADAGDGDQPTTETELRLEEDAEAVQVVTVHGSKGLQYPIALCPDLWDGGIKVDRDIFRLHDPDEEDPLAATKLDLDADRYGPSKAASYALAVRQERTEGLRLAYVALTRAQHASVVWWGALTDAATSSLASLLHGHAPAEADEAHADGEAGSDPMARGEERVKTARDAGLLEDLRVLADGSGGAIAVEAVDELLRDARWEPGAEEPPTLAALPFTRGNIDRAWRRASFTGLVRGAGAYGGSGDPHGRDVDAEVEEETTDEIAAEQADVPAPDPAGPPAEEVPLAGLPRGAGPGTFLHDVLERLDFTSMDDDEAVAAVVTAQAGRHGIDLRHRDAVVRGLRAAIATPIAGISPTVPLADLAPGNRLDELRFELPLAGGHIPGDAGALTLGRIGDLLDGSGDPLLERYAERLRDPALRPPVRGYLNGSIDLLARLPGDRFLVADYKSNWLGDRATRRSVADDYGLAALSEQLLDHHYVLQALLYLVAAHRYLRWRVDGYDYDTHVAGAAYLFVRGMVGPPAGTPTGIALIRPTGELVAALSGLLDRPRGAA